MFNHPTKLGLSGFSLLFCPQNQKLRMSGIGFSFGLPRTGFGYICIERIVCVMFKFLCRLGEGEGMPREVPRNTSTPEVTNLQNNETRCSIAAEIF